MRYERVCGLIVMVCGGFALFGGVVQTLGIVASANGGIIITLARIIGPLGVIAAGYVMYRHQLFTRKAAERK